jgi:hypothetical protein
MFHGLFQKIRLDRGRLFHAIRFAKLFDVLIRADKRLPGHLRDLASEGLSTAGVIPLIAASLAAPSMRVSAGFCSAIICLSTL